LVYNAAMEENANKKQKKQRKPQSAMDRALGYLGYRMRTEKEMTDYLTAKQYPEEEIAEVMARLVDYGYIDDAAFCKEYLRTKLDRGAVGRRKIRYDLSQKGITGEIIEAALMEYDAEGETENCIALVQKLSQTRGTDQKAKASIQRTLLSKGFSYDTIRTAMARLKEEDWE